LLSLKFDFLNSLKITSDENLSSHKIDDILKLEKLKSNLQIEIENIISNNKEINADLLQERDYSKTLEEKIASLKDKAILEQTKNAKSSEEIIKNNASRSAKLRYITRCKSDFFYPNDLKKKFIKYLEVEDRYV